MLYMTIVRHTPESCPGRPENQELVPCLNRMTELLTERGIKTIGRWANPPAHVNYLVLDAPSAHAVLEVLMESGLMAHTTTEIHPVLSMD